MEKDEISEREAIKRKMNSQGIPVGFGMPENPMHTRKSEEEKEREEYEELPNETEEDILGRLLDQDIGYSRQPAPTEMGQLIQFINSLKPFKVEPIQTRDGKVLGTQIKDGDVPQDVLIDYWGFLSPPNSLSNYTRHDYEMTMADLDVAQLSYMMSRPRESYTMQRLAMEDNVTHLVRAKNLQSVGGFERIMSTTQRLEEEKGLRIQRKPGRLETLKKNLKGGMD